jgi:hypothetical protein
MGSGRDLYNACCIFEGQPYSTAPGRTDPLSGHKDCSGLVAAGFEVCQGYELGAYVSVTIFDQSVKAGLEIPLWAAENIVGALIYKPEDPYQGWGANGHIAVSDGHGGTIEATPPRVQRLPLSYNAPWSSKASLAIDLDYSNYGEGTPPIPAPLKEEELMNPVLIWDVPTGKISVYDPNNHTATHVSNPAALDSIVRWWDFYRFVNNGNGPSSQIIATDHPELGATVKGLIDDAAQVRAFDDVTPPGEAYTFTDEDIDKIVKAVNDDAAARMAE